MTLREFGSCHDDAWSSYLYASVSFSLNFSLCVFDHFSTQTKDLAAYQQHPCGVHAPYDRRPTSPSIYTNCYLLTLCASILCSTLLLISTSVTIATEGCHPLLSCTRSRTRGKRYAPAVGDVTKCRQHQLSILIEEPAMGDGREDLNDGLGLRTPSSSSLIGAILCYVG